MASAFLLSKSARSLSGSSSTPYLDNPFIIFFKRYSQHRGGENQKRGVEERAPSLADEFRRVAEEKAKANGKTAEVADQSIATQPASTVGQGATQPPPTDGQGVTLAVKNRDELGHD